MTASNLTDANKVGTYAGEALYFVKASDKVDRLYCDIQDDRGKGWFYFDKETEFFVDAEYDTSMKQYYLGKGTSNYELGKRDYSSEVNSFFYTSEPTLDSSADHLLFLIYYDGDDSMVYVLLEWPATVISPVDTAKLDTALAALNADCYQADDRYNGKTTVADVVTELKANETIAADADTQKLLNVSYTGFWSLYQAAMGRVDAIYPESNGTRTLADGVKQAQVDAATEFLATAIANLIPATEVNATELYETIQKYTTGYEGYYETEADRPVNEHGFKQGHLLSDYSDFTANAYRAALAEAEDFLAGLFDENGNATENNKIERQSAADDCVAALKKAVGDLTGNYDITFMHTRLAKLELRFPYTEADSADFTAKSWEAYSNAKNDIYGFLQDHPDPTVYVSSDANTVNEYFDTYYKACHLLQSSADAITVDFRVADNYGALNPAEAWGAADGLFHRELTVANTCTVKDLIAAAYGAGLTKDITEEDAIASNNKYSYLVYLNGVAVMNSIATEALKLWDLTGYNWNKVIVRDGDEVLILRTEEPKGEYYIHLTQASFGTYSSSIGMMRFGDASDVTVKANESFTLNVERAGAYLNEYTGAYRPRANAELIVYGPKAEDGSYPISRSGAITDNDGKASLALLQEGEYLIVAVDTRAQDTANNIYPNLSAGTAPVKVTVTALAADELAKAISDAKTELDEFWNGVDQTMFDYNRLQSCTAAYEEAAAAIAGAASLYDAVTAKDNCINEISDVLEVIEAENEVKLGSFTRSLALLPDDATVLNTSHSERLLYISQLYSSMTGYQQGRLTVAESNKYQANMDYWFANYDKLPAGVRSSVIVKAAEGEESYLENWKLNLSKSFVKGYDLSAGSWAQYVAGESANRTYSYVDNAFDMSADQLIVLENGTVSISVGRPQGDSLVKWVEIFDAKGNQIEPGTIKLYDEDNLLNDDFRGDKSLWTAAYIQVDSMPADELTVILHFTEQEKTEDELLQDALDAVKADLKAVFDSYSKPDYSSAKWTELVAAYNNGVNAIAAAADAEAAKAAAEDAKAAMAAVEKRQQGGTEPGGNETVGDLGSVHVVIENTTFSGGAFTGTIVDTQMPLYEDSTMMGLVLGALERNGYSWGGTGGIGYGISYLSYIYKDKDNDGMYDVGEPKMGEFDGLPTSGWMGTLNDWFVNEGFPAFTAAASDRDKRIVDGDEVRVMYTNSGLGEDIGGTWGSSDTSLKSLEVKGGKLSPAFNGSTTQYILSLTKGDVTVTPTAANKNYLVKTFINEKVTANGKDYYRRGESLPVAEGDVIYIGVGERNWLSMNNQGDEARDYSGTWYSITLIGSSSADSVIELIKNIGSITYSNYEQAADAVKLARTAYDCLDKDAKEDVSNYSKLTGAEEDVVFYQEIDEVKDLLAKIPAVNKLTKADKSKVQAARKAYDALDDDQKLYITVSDVAKYNDAVEWLSKQGISSGGSISGSTAAPEIKEEIKEEIVEPGVSGKLPFTDVKDGSWFYAAVESAYNDGLMTGVTNTTFEPNAPLSRAMLVTILYRMEGAPTVTAAGTFSDVKAGQWYTDAITWAAANDIVNGHGEGKFAPNENVTREQMAAIMMRYSEYKDYDVAKSNELSKYADADTVSSWALKNMQWANAAGLITGDEAGKLNPQGKATRAEAATILMRYLENIAA